jgi:hypothetical protein
MRQLLPVAGKDLRVVRSTRDGNISHAVVEQVFRAKVGIDMDEHPVGGLSLARMAGHGVAVVQVRVRSGVDLDAATVVPKGQAVSLDSD